MYILGKCINALHITSIVLK